MTRIALNALNPTYPTWTTDGKHIVLRFVSEGGFSLGWIRADGAGETLRLLESKNTVLPFSFFPDGQRVGTLSSLILRMVNNYGLYHST